MTSKQNKRRTNHRLKDKHNLNTQEYIHIPHRLRTFIFHKTSSAWLVGDNSNSLVDMELLFGGRANTVLLW
jgi:hypothetical protein